MLQMPAVHHHNQWLLELVNVPTDDREGIAFDRKDHRLRLIAEMKLPGRAWLEFEVTGSEDGSLIRQTAIFDPVGFAGLAYWYAMYPLHLLVFGGMLRGIARAATRGV